MTIRHLKIFIRVCERENITRAAADMHMTQPAVTRAVRELEEHYGRRLFERIHRRIYITEAGELLYRQARYLTAAMDRIEESMADWDETGVIRIGAGTTLGCVLLPRVLSEFREKHPGMTLRSIVTDTARLQEMLLKNEIDFALIEGRPDDPSLSALAIGKDRMVLVLPRDHPLCRKENITVQDLAQQPLIVSETGSASRTFMEHLFSIHGMRLDPVMESGSMPVILQAVGAGLGIALIPQKIFSLYGNARAIEERALSYEVLTRESHLVWHGDRYIGTSAREFIALVRACGAEVLA